MNLIENRLTGTLFYNIHVIISIRRASIVVYLINYAKIVISKQERLQTTANSICLIIEWVRKSQIRIHSLFCSAKTLLTCTAYNEAKVQSKTNSTIITHHKICHSIHRLMYEISIPWVYNKIKKEISTELRQKKRLKGYIIF